MTGTARSESAENAHGPVVDAAVPTCKCGRQFKTWRAQGIHETAERRKLRDAEAES